MAPLCRCTRTWDTPLCVLDLQGLLRGWISIRKEKNLFFLVFFKQSEYLFLFSYGMQEVIISSKTYSRTEINNRLVNSSQVWGYCSELAEIYDKRGFKVSSFPRKAIVIVITVL